MKKVSVLLISQDTTWSNMLSNYVETHHKRLMKLDYIHSEVVTPEYFNGTYDLILSDDIGFEIDDFTKRDSLKFVKIISESGHETSENTVYKYLPANELVSRLHALVTGNQDNNPIKHYVFAASYETELSYMSANRFCEELSSEGHKPLLISLSHPNTKSLLVEGQIKDPFGRLLYYATLSSSRIVQELDTLVEGGQSGASYIRKPYAFDFSQWTPELVERLLEAFGTQGRHNIIIWHIGCVYASGMAKLLELCEKLIWIGMADRVELDTVLDTYVKLSGCRLDLKTQYELIGDRLMCSPDITHLVEKVCREAHKSKKGVSIC